MGLLDRLFGKKRERSATTAADAARGERLVGQETGQTADEQAATRGRMEAELDAQRERRTSPPSSDA